MIKKTLTMILTATLLFPTQLLTVNGEDDNTEDEKTVESEETTEATEGPSNPSEEAQVIPDTLPEDLDIDVEEIDDKPNQSKENNSISMLNYLTVLSQEINASKNSRLFLEEAYSAIINDTYPNAVDSTTKDHLENMLDIIESLRMVDVKRERLSYLYQQNQAQAIRSAIPNPLALLSAVESFDLKRLIASGIYMAVDSITSYNAYKNQLELQYLKDGWALDDEQAKDVSDSRREAFIYMIDIVNDNNLPGEYALNEESVAELVKWKNNTNVTSRIQFLEDNEETYREYGGYWLILAASYYEKNDYENCLKATETYEEKQGKIFRIDHEFAKVLPYAIVSVKETEKNSNDRINKIEHYNELLIGNTKNDDWALRYFAAQAYVELAAETRSTIKKKDFLQKAYKVARSNVNYLVEEQNTKNFAYMADIVEKKEPANASKDEKKEVKNYNKLLKEERKIALPPISEALLLNCDLMFALASETKVDSKEQNKLNEILHPNGSPLFLNEVLDSQYWFNGNKTVSTSEVNYDKKKMTIPASFIANDYVITVTADEGNNKTVFDDWKLEEVKRGDKNDISTFIAELTSEKSKKYKLKENTTITIEINPTTIIESDPVIVKYETVHKKFLWFIDTIELKKVE